jgi:hypothetical protein
MQKFTGRKHAPHGPIAAVFVVVVVVSYCLEEIDRISMCQELMDQWKNMPNIIVPPLYDMQKFTGRFTGRKCTTNSYTAAAVLELLFHIV